MALTEEEAARLDRLRQARELHISGGAVTKVSAHGRSKDMAPADLERLEGDIAALEAKAVRGRIRRRGAITFRFRR